MNTNMLKQELKQSRRNFLIYIGLLAITLFISYLICMDNGSNRLINLFFVFSLFSTAIYGIALFASALSKFDFMHNKSKTDFYHNLPIDRKSLFLTKFTTPIITFTIPYAIINLVVFIFAIIFSNSRFVTTIDFVNAFYLLVSYLISSLILYSFLTFIGTLTSKTIYQAFIMIQTVVFAFVFVICGLVLLNSVVNRGITLEAPFAILFGSINYITIYNILSIIGILIAILFTILSIKFYKNYKSEYTGKFLTTKTITKVYIILTSLVVGVGFGTMFNIIFLYSIGSNIFIVISATTLVTAIISYIVLTILITRKNKFDVKSLAILIVLCILFLLATIFDIFNLNGIVPNTDSIVAASVNYENSTNPSDFEKITELQQLVIDNSVPMPNSYNSYNSSDLDDSYMNIYFDYELKTFNNQYSFYREYCIPTSCNEVIDALNSFYTSDEYKKEQIDTLKSIQETNFTYIDTSINICDNYLNISDESDVDDLIDALILDIENDDTFGYYNEQPVNFATLYLNYEINNDAYYNGSYGFNINYKYTNTLKFIEEKYKEENGENTSIFDNMSICVVDSSNFDDLKDEATSLGMEYISSNYINLPYNEFEQNIYSYNDDKEEVLELLKTPIYVTPNENLVKVSGDLTYFNTFNWYLVK